MKTNLKIILRNDFTRKDGSKSIYLRVIIKHKVKNISLGITARQKDFKKGHIRLSDPDYQSKNLIIDAALDKARKIDFDARLEFKELTIHQFSNSYFNYKSKSLSFYDFYDKELPYMKEKLAGDTLRGYSTQVSKMKKFRPHLSFQEIDLQFIKDYERYMLTLATKEKTGNAKSTVNKSLSFVKAMLNRAIAAGIINSNPFENHPLERTDSTREHLNASELKTLDDLYWGRELPENKSNVLRYFLFCCYTGLRYRDIKDLRWCDIQKNTDDAGIEYKIIVIDMHKTGKPVRIPLVNQALSLMPGQGFEKQKVFKVLADQPTNRYLKEIMEKAEIRKSISFHCSRHTFATVAIFLKIPLETVSKILGHTDLKTTLIYAKYDDQLKIAEMQKWNRVG